MGARKANRKKTGRPSKRQGIDLVLVKELARNGKTPPQIASELGIATSTIYEWMKESKAFSDALNAGRAVADERVEASLYERCLGYEHPEEKIFCVDGEIVRANTVKKYPPDVMAMIFWLKNRRPGAWKDKQEVEHFGEVDLVGSLAGARRRSGLEPEGQE